MQGNTVLDLPQIKSGHALAEGAEQFGAGGVGNLGDVGDGLRCAAVRAVDRGNIVRHQEVCAAQIRIVRRCSRGRFQQSMFGHFGMKIVKTGDGTNNSGSVITGATTATVTIENVTTNLTGLFRVMVSGNGVPTVTSASVKRPDHS